MVDDCRIPTPRAVDAARALLGERYHPGGFVLSRRLLEWLRLQPGQQFADVTCGQGATAFMAALEYKVDIEGVSFLADDIEHANAAIGEHGLTGHATFRHAETESLPLAEGAFDAVICESGLGSFSSMSAAVAEMVRALRPGGRLGLTSVVAEPDRLLPGAVAEHSSWLPCVGGARPVREYQQVLAAEGLRLEVLEQHPEAVERVIRHVSARVAAMRHTGREEFRDLGLDFDEIPDLIRATQDAVSEGVLNCVLMVATKR